MPPGATVRRLLRPPQPSLAPARAAPRPLNSLVFVDRGPHAQMDSNRRYCAATIACPALLAASRPPPASPVLSIVVPCDPERWERARVLG